MTKINTLIDCPCMGKGYLFGWVSPDGDYDFERCDCNVCYFGLMLEESVFPANPATLCQTHRLEWINEKTFEEGY